MTNFDEVLELESPHGFLISQKRQTHFANPDKMETGKKYLIVTNGEAFGIAQFGQPGQVNVDEFDRTEWSKKHKVTAMERRLWWPQQEAFYVYPIDEWQPLEGKLYKDHQLIDVPELTGTQKLLVEDSSLLPRQIPLISNAVMVTEAKSFVFNEAIDRQALADILAATYDIKDVFADNEATKAIPIYSLALVRCPVMRVESVPKKKELPQAIKQEDGEEMPFRIRRRGEEYCVVKVNPDDSDGETEGCHDTEEDAQAQLTALNINVVAEEKDLTIEEQPVKVKKSWLSGLKEIAKSITDFLSLAESEDHAITVQPFETKAGIAQKEVDGELWHITWSTNAFEDREKEIFSTKSLENYVLANEANEDKGFFNLWHINEEDGNFNTDFAVKRWQGVAGRFLIEAGPYLPDEKGRLAKEFFALYPNGHPDIAPEGWGGSPEYKYFPEERATGVYENIWISRTSTLPRMAAANFWTDARQTRSNKMTLTESQLKAAQTLFGEDYINQLVTEAESKTAELEAAGVAHKDKSPEPEEPKTEELGQITFDQKQFEALAGEIAKQMNISNEPLLEGLGTMAQKLGEVESRLNELETQKAATEQAEMPRFTFDWKRASQSEETIVTEDDDLKNQKPQEAGKQRKNASEITPAEFFGQSRA